MTDIDVGYDLDPSGYLAGVNQIDQANQRLQSSIGSVTTTTTGLQRAMSLVTPTRATIAGFTAMAAAAAANQQAMSGLAATSAITGTRLDRLAGGIRQMARDMPLGSAATRGIVEQFTRSGVAAAGSETKISALTKTVSQLSGATGEGPAQLAAGMTELARATGNSNLDPRRFSAMGDALTTVSAQSGSSASGVLAFSRTIAPMAQAAGIGTTGILGISSAFSRLGEDGLGASTAVNKMLADMNRAVREGSPEMKVYAQMAGKSADEFERLFKSNPAEALTQITEAVSKAGPQGPRMLEQLGIEGIRGQRAIQALVASGGLRPAIDQATAAYGSGSTQKAAEAAFGGLNDSLNELGEASKQVAEAFGAPLLGPLTSFTNLLKGVTGGVARVASSGPAQTLGTVATYGAIGMLGAKAISGPLGALMLGRQAMTSGILASAAGGYAQGRGLGEGSRIFAMGAGAIRAEEEGRLRSGFTGTARGRVFDFTSGFGAARTPMGPQTDPLLRRIIGATGVYANNIGQTYFGMLSQQARNARVPWEDRQSSWGASQGFKQAANAARGAADAAGGPVSGATAGLKAFNASLMSSDKGLKSFNNTVTAATRAAGQAAMFGARGAGDAGRGLRGIGSLLGGTGMLATLGLTAGIGLAAYGVSNAQAKSEERAQYLDKDISATINAYRESIGKATNATITFGSVSDQLVKNLATQAKSMTFKEALRLTEADVTAANTSQGKIINRYQGSSDVVAAQIMAANAGGVTTEELQAIKVDLARQLPESTVRDVLSKLPASFEAKAGGEGMSAQQTAEATKTLIKGVADIEPSFWGGLLSKIQTGPGGSGNSMASLDQASKTPSWLNWFGRGGALTPSTLNETSIGQIQQLTEGVAQQYTRQSDKFGGAYAEQERTKAINAALKAAYDSGNADVFMELSNRLGQQIGGRGMKDKIWSPEDFKRAGFDFSANVAAESDAYKEARQKAIDAGARFTGEGGLKPELVEQQYTKNIRPVSPFLGDVFDARSKSAAATAMTASLAAPADMAKQSQALDVVVQAANKAGKSMEDLAIEAAKAASATGEGTDAWMRLKSIQSRAEYEMSNQAMATGMTDKEAQLQQYSYQSRLAEMTPTTEAEAQQQAQARQNKLAIEQQMRAQMVARLQIARQAEVAERRAREDYQRQTLYATQDYNVQVFRLNRNFAIQQERSAYSFRLQAARAEADYQRSRSRTIRDFNISLRRNEEDFNTSRMRQLRDFAISAARAEADYLKTRSRQIRDFNITLKRQIEDAAASMLDPYTRLQTKATWDAKNLIVNLQQQTASMLKQKEQLDALRKMGLSASAIDQLGLGKVENAQQVNNLAADANPEIIGQLNEIAKQRAAASGGLFTDESNKELARQREDFQRSLKDQEEDFRLSVERTREDLKRQMADQNKDYQKALARSREDLAKSLRDSDKDFARSMARSREDFNTNLRYAKQDLNTTLTDMEADRNKSMARSKKALDVQLARMNEDIMMADQQIAGSMSDLAEQTNKAIHGQAVTWQKILKNDTASWVTSMQQNVIPKLLSAYKSMGINVKDVQNAAYSTAAYAAAHPDRLASGGPVRGYSPHDRADNIPIMATAGEFMHPVKTVNYYSPAIMEKIRRREIPREALQGFADGGMVYQQMTKWVHANLPGVRITSGYRPGAITALGNVSMHAKGKALDLAPSMSTFNKILSSFGARNIYQLFYSPANGRTILRGKPWYMDSVTKGDHWNHVHWAMNSMTGAGGGAGSLISLSRLNEILKKMPNNPGIQRAISVKVAKALNDKWKALAASGGGGDVSGPGYKGEDAVARWAPNVATVLRMLGRGQGESGAVLRRIDFESGGNPRAINNWDSNARAGTPSKGLMQVIDPTFRAYHSRSLPNDIWHPTANIYAGSNYAVKRYGSLAAIDPRVRPRGYDEGGKMPPGTGLYSNGTTKPEAVLTKEQWDSISKLAEKAGQIISATDLKGVNAAAGAHIVVNNHQRYSYDNRNDFSGAEFTVVADDPAEMLDKLEALQTTRAITQTRGVRRTT